MAAKTKTEPRAANKRRTTEDAETTERIHRLLSVNSVLSVVRLFFARFSILVFGWGKREGTVGGPMEA